MSSSDLLTVLAAVVVVLVGAATGLATYLNSRRSGSGKVATSEAAVLWQQSQDMRAMLLTEKERAEEQRDKLIAAYTEQVLPVLSSVNQLVQDLTGATTEIVGIVRGIRDDLEGGGHGIAAASADRADSH